MTRYDLIVGMGKACSCSMSLRKAGLQHLSLPFDWMRFNDEAYPAVRAKHDRRIARRKHDRPRGMRRLWQALAGICSRKDCT